MAKNTGIGIDIGNSQIKVVQIRKTSNGIKIEKYFIANYDLPPSDLESPEVRNKKKQEILGKIFSELRPTNIVSAVAKGEDNIRTISMPLMSEKSLREALKWGGQPEYIPFDLKEMVWDVVISQVYRRKEEIKVEGKEKMDVVIALAKKNIVNEYLDIFDSLKAHIDILETNILAGLNFTCYNLALPKDRVWSKMDFGAEATTVNILEGTNLKFSLNIPFGINDICQAVLSIISTTWAEAAAYVGKIDFSLDPAFQPDATSQKIMQLLEPKMKDFLRQLSGAFSFYESKNPGRSIESVLLSGGGANLISYAKYLSLKINRNVKIENEINKNIISYDKKHEKELISLLPSLSVAIGAALRNVVEVKNNANLLPLEIMLGRKLKSRRTSTITIIVLVFLALAGLIVYRYKERNVIVENIKIVSGELSKLSSEAGELGKMKQAVDSFEEIKSDYLDLKKTLTPWSSVMIEFSSIVPDRVWIDLTNWNDKGSVGISGRCPTKYDQVKLFSDEGDKSDYFKGLQQSRKDTSGEEIDFSLDRRAEKKRGSR